MSERPEDERPEDGTVAEPAETVEATPEAEPGPSGDAPQPEAPAKRPGNGVALLAILLSVVALAAVGYTTWTNWRAAADTSTADSIAQLDERLDASREALSDLQASIDAASSGNADVATAVDVLRRDLDDSLRPVISLPGRVATLEDSVASLAGISEGARNTWLLAEAEYYMQIGNAQLQLASNPELATLAMRMADERIAQLADPALLEVRRALADELAALDAMEKPDIAGTVLTLSSLAHVADTLPLASLDAKNDEDANVVDPDMNGFERAWASVKNALSGLVKVTPPEQAELTLVTPDAAFFLRNNVALQLQAAQLALLRGEQDVFRQILDDTSSLLTAYFDTGSAPVRSALETLAEVRDDVVTSTPPDISESLRLLRQYRTLNESAQ